MNKIYKYFIKTYISCLRAIKSNKINNKIVLSNSKMHIFYRISDAGYKKNKPDYINNENCLRNALSRFPLNTHDWTVIADNCSEQTINMIYSYIPNTKVHLVSVGNGAGTFRICLDYALNLSSDTIVYFLENDYLHRDQSSAAIAEGLQIAPYVTLYDHPDKYDVNHFAFNQGAEKTRVFLTTHTHWKYTHSTTMTFATLVSTLKEDIDVFRRWTETSHPFDCEIFVELKFRGKRLLSPIPSFSTHGETEFLSPIIDWSIEAKI